MRRGIAVTGALLITAAMLAGCGDDGSSESAPPESPESTSSESSETEESAPDVSEDAATPEDEASAPVELVDVLVISHQLGNLMWRESPPDACARHIQVVQEGGVLPNAVLVQEGGVLVELAVSGEDSPRTADWSPSATNGTPLPCRVEALFENVPAGADSYTATQVGASGTPFETTVTGAELAAAGNEIVLVHEKPVEADPSEDEGDGVGGFGVIGGIDTDALLAAECLSGESTLLKIIKNYSQYSSSGRGDDIFVMHREKMTNNCDKDIKAFTYTSVFEDVFGDIILRGDSKFSIRIKVGRSKQTPKDKGYVVNSYDENFQAWNNAKARDITVTIIVRQIVFSDGTKIDIGR